MLHAPRHQTIDLQVAEDSCVLAKAREIDIVLQQLFGFAAEAIVKRVDEVEGYGARS